MYINIYIKQLTKFYLSYLNQLCDYLNLLFS